MLKFIHFSNKTEHVALNLNFLNWYIGRHFSILVSLISADFFYDCNFTYTYTVEYRIVK